MRGPTYRAIFEATGAVIYSGRPNGNLIGELPLGARPLPRAECGTLDRADQGDPFESARFILPSLRVVRIEREAP